MRPIMRAMLAFALMLSSTVQSATPYRAHMTGEQFVRDMLAAPDGGLNSMRRERAMGYMDGVMDAAVGLRWCPAGAAVPHELNYVAAEEMQSLPPARLKGDAAALVLAVLAKLYPCGPKR
jgi:hypothetical protein